MTDLRTAAQQALEALEFMADEWGFTNKANRPERWKAIESLRAALEQPEQTNPWRDAVDHELSTLHMVASDDPRESIRRLIDWHCAVQIDPLVSSAAQELIERGRREREQPEQEPVAWMVYTQDGKSVCVTDNPADFIEWRSFPLYTRPPRREWQGLTEEEVINLSDLRGGCYGTTDFARAIEAALKERNT